LELCFDSSIDYRELLSTWMILTKVFTGWSLSEIQELSYKERANWLELAREYEMTLRKNRQ
jgi:hypothetical protein